jgi:hypothetical protein
MQQLVNAEAEDLHDLEVESSQRSPGKVRDQVIEGRTLTLDTRGNFSGKGAIAVVAERFPRVSDSGGKIRAAAGDSQKDFVGGQAGRRNHECEPKRSPGSI